MVALDAKAETIYYLRFTATARGYYFGDQIFMSKDIKTQLETVSEAEAQQDINENFHLLNLALTSYKKTR